MSGLPSQIGRYEIRKELGRGMMGVVYEAHDPTLGRTIALKTIQVPAAASPREREDYEKRFLAEARIAARLSHPGIVVVHDVARDGEVLYIALEHLHGRTLDDVVAEGPIEWREALRIVGRLAEALRYAHGQGVVHRDIKPANVMLMPNGEPKIMDFGIARLEAGHLTAAGQFFGTPLYMSPEQARGEAVDARTDLFSLGSVAYLLLSGRPPFEAANVPGILARVAYQHPKPLGAFVPGMPAEVEYVVARAMAKDPQGRYPDGRLIAEDVEDILAGRPPRHRDGWAPPPTGEGTLASRPGGDLPELALEPAEESPAPAERPPAPQRPARRRRPSLRLVALLIASAAAYFAVHPADRQFWRRAGEAARRSSLVEEMLAQWPGTIVEPAPPPPATTVVTATAAPRASGGEFAALPSHPLGMPPAAPEGPASASPVPGESEPAWLEVEFEHHLRRGNLRVFVDDTSVVDEELDGRVTRKILALELRKGVVQRLVSLGPGRHDVRVQVRWDDKVRTGRITGEFPSGATRRLGIQVGRIGGKLGLELR